MVAEACLNNKVEVAPNNKEVAEVCHNNNNNNRMAVVARPNNNKVVA